MRESRISAIWFSSHEVEPLPRDRAPAHGRGAQGCTLAGVV
jgi:hypothetical protein